MEPIVSLIRMKIIICISFAFFLSSLSAQNVNDDIKYKMYLKALCNTSTSPYYIVINVKNVKDNISKEVCIEAPDLVRALKLDGRLFFIRHKLLKNKGRFFTMKSEKALAAVGFYLYDINDSSQYVDKLDIENSIMKVKSGTNQTKIFDCYANMDSVKNVYSAISNKEFNNCYIKQVVFAHIMFNKGILARRGCLLGNIVLLEDF